MARPVIPAFRVGQTVALHWFGGSASSSARRGMPRGNHTAVSPFSWAPKSERSQARHGDDRGLEASRPVAQTSVHSARRRTNPGPTAGPGLRSGAVVTNRRPRSAWGAPHGNQESDGARQGEGVHGRDRKRVGREMRTPAVRGARVPEGPDKPPMVRTYAAAPAPAAGTDLGVGAGMVGTRSCPGAEEGDVGASRCGPR
jgi:hypothetical protein